MPELFLKAEEYVSSGKFKEAKSIQKDINDIIIQLTTQDGSMYAVIKEIIKLQGIDIGTVRSPFEGISDQDKDNITQIKKMIDTAIIKYSRSEEHTSELQSRGQLVCSLL